jgi:DNA-binding NarL/FixJ family response regulator
VNTRVLPTSIDRSPAEAVAIGIAAGDDVTLRRLHALATQHGLTVSAEATALDRLAVAAPVAAMVAACDPTTAAVRDELRALRRRSPGVGLLVVLDTGSPSAVRAALRAGADGVALEPEREQVLGPAVRVVAAGQVTVPRAARSQVDRQPLSSREKQVLGLVVMGFTNAEIGARLYLAESTVKSHLSSSFSKLGVRSRKEAVALILDPEEGVGTGILAIAKPDVASTEVPLRGNGRFSRPTVTERGFAQ